MHRLGPVLIAGLLAFAGAVAPSPLAPAAAASSNPKIVLIVGATHAATSSYREDMDAVYATALQYTPNVVKIYSPNATWATVKAALQGANIVVYMGHGNGFPSPYTTTLAPDRQDGFGLNATAGQGDDNTTYFGESFIGSSVTLASNAVVILAHLCYASGNSEPGKPAPTLAVAQARIDNFSAGFIKAGARAVIADAHADTSWYLDALFTGHETVDQLFRSKPFAAGHTFTFESSRTPGFTAYSDPETDSPPADFYRSMVALPALRTDDVTGASSSGDVGIDPALVVPGAAEVTDAAGIGLYADATLTPAPSTGMAPVILPAGTRLRLLGSEPAPAGGLAYRVMTIDGTRTGFVRPAGLTARDGSPPAIRSFAVAPAAISPAVDGGAAISGTASKPVDWSIGIIDAEDRQVASFASSGLAFSTAWTGRDAAGQPVADGLYRVLAVAGDAWGNPPASAGAVLVVDGTPPVVSPAGAAGQPIVVSPNGDGLNETAPFAFSLSEPSTLLATVRDAAGAPVRTFTLAAPAGPGSVTWDGLGTGAARLPDGPYLLSVTASDAAGNVGPGISATVVIATARSGLSATPAWISPTGRDAQARASNLAFALARPATVTWQVTTTAGVPVRTWYASAPLPAGAYAARWDGRDDAGALVTRGRYLSRVTVADGVTSTTEQAWVYSDGIRILTSDVTPAAGQAVTITVAAVEALGANPTVWITQPGRARIGYRTTKVGASTYRAVIRLRTGPAGSVTVRVSGLDRFGRAASASTAYRLH